MSARKRGSNKPQARQRFKESFRKRYGIDYREWCKTKREWRARGEGYKINKLMVRAYKRFLQWIRLKK